jgi:hypothetical protein
MCDVAPAPDGLQGSNGQFQRPAMWTAWIRPEVRACIRSFRIGRGRSGKIWPPDARVLSFVGSETSVPGESAAAVKRQLSLPACRL